MQCKVLKKQLRTRMLARRQSLSDEEWRTLSKAAQDWLLAWPGFIRAMHVALYMPIRCEPDTALLLDSVLSTRPVLLPRVDRPRKMDFYPCSDLTRLEPGPFGLVQPAATRPQMPDLIIAPGLAFDLEGNRLGYGGGYYDSYLEAHPACIVIGLCFGFEILERVPADDRDRRVDGICSENGLIWR